MKVLWGHLDWVLGTLGPLSDPADKTFLGMCIVSNVSKWSNLFVKNGVKTSVAGSCTKRYDRRPKSPTKNDRRKYKIIMVITTGNRNEYTTCYLLDYPYFKESYLMVAIDLSKPW